MSGNPDNLPARAHSVDLVVGDTEGTARRALIELRGTPPEPLVLSDEYMLAHAATLKRLPDDDLTIDAPTARMLFRGPTYLAYEFDPEDELADLGVLSVLLFAVEQTLTRSGALRWVFSVWYYTDRESIKPGQSAFWTGTSSAEGLEQYRWCLRHQVQYPKTRSLRLARSGVSRPTAATVREGYRWRKRGLSTSALEDD